MFNNLTLLLLYCFSIISSRLELDVDKPKRYCIKRKITWNDTLWIGKIFEVELIRLEKRFLVFFLLIPN